jgi:chemotaxis protein methyltransferase CheR
MEKAVRRFQRAAMILAGRTDMPTQTQDALDFEFIIGLVYERCRIRLHDGKQQLIRSRLGKRMRACGFDSLSKYCDYLRRTHDEEELTHMVDAITTNFTNFLREQDHFDFMINAALPALLVDRRRFRIWSAACATGEEAYTLAFYLWERYPIVNGWDWQVEATDISTKALTTARQAIYPEDRLSALPPDWWPKFFQKGHDDWEGFYRIKPDLASRVAFRQLNLLGEYSFSEPFPVIFCRNVMIYFDRPTQEQLVQRLCQSLMPHGYLIIGNSESLNGLRVPLQCVQPGIYQRV